MGILLIMARSALHSDPVEDRRGSYKAFDPVSAFEDGEVGGTKMGLPNFYQLHVTDVPKSVLQTLCEEQTEDDDGNPYYPDLPAATPEPSTFRRRRWSMSGLSPGMLKILKRDGVLTLPPGQAKQLFKRKRDQRRFRDFDNL